jgi:hypothetical protein
MDKRTEPKALKGENDNPASHDKLNEHLQPGTAMYDVNEGKISKKKHP